jgi:hypothetical protein
MKFQVLAVLLLVFLVSCAEKQESANAAKATDAATAPAPGDTQDSDSHILAEKKCPKNSKVVNGKCTLAVESTE